MDRSPAVEVRRAADRAVTAEEGRSTRHSFAFGAHFDPTNTSFGLLVAHNDDHLEPGAGYGPHPHRDLEIVTWVTTGALTHEDSTGRGGVVEPGLVQRLSAGRGVVHSERNLDPGRSLRFVQMWVTPEVSGGEPGYAQREVGERLSSGLVVVASGVPRYADDAAVPLGNRHAALHAGRLADGSAQTLPDAPYLHLFVVDGAVDLEGAGALAAGDAARLRGGGRRVTALGPAEVLVWEMHAAR